MIKKNQQITQKKSCEPTTQCKTIHNFIPHWNLYVQVINNLVPVNQWMLCVSVILKLMMSYRTSTHPYDTMLELLKKKTTILCNYVTQSSSQTASSWWKINMKGMTYNLKEKSILYTWGTLIDKFNNAFPIFSEFKMQKLDNCKNPFLKSHWIMLFTQNKNSSW